METCMGLGRIHASTGEPVGGDSRHDMHHHGVAVQWYFPSPYIMTVQIATAPDCIVCSPCNQAGSNTHENAIVAHRNS